MKLNKMIIITGLVMLALGLLVGWLVFRTTSNVDVHVHEEALGEATIWTCSMHPQIRANEPGDCPICGMDLIPVEEAGYEENPLAIQMSATAMQLANIRTSVVGTAEPVKEIRLNGKVQPDEREVYTQTTHIPGRIERLMVDFTGEQVRKGQVLAYIYSPELVNAQQELLIAQRVAENQPQLLKSAKEKLKNWKLTEAQINQILESGEVKENFPILSDVSGIVVEKNVNPGDYVQRGALLYRVANLSEVWVLFEVYEDDLRFINEGDEVEFIVRSLPGEIFTGEITFVDPVINTQTRVARARVEVRNPNNRLKPGMFATGNMKTRVATEPGNLVIPKSAVMWTGERSVVYVKVASPEGISFVMREVILGPEVEDSYIIKEGLHSGEVIATSGTFAIDAAAQLAGKPSMMNSQDGVMPTGHDHDAISSMDAGDEIGSTETIKANQTAKEAIGTLALQYVKIQEALAADNYAVAQKAAAGLYDLFQNTPMTLFTGEGHDVWMEKSSKAAEALRMMVDAESIEQFREHFDELSSPVIALAKAFQPGQEDLYIQYCPMANNNTGAFWLSTESEIENPYFGAAMHSCGETTEKINGR